MGFFARRPSRAEQQKWVAVSQRTVPLFAQLAQHRQVKYADGQIVDLAEHGQRALIVSSIDELTRTLQLAPLSPCTLGNVDARAKRIHDLVNAKTYARIGPVVETAQGIVLGLNVHEMLCCYYFEVYPKFEPLREMIDGNLKIMSHALLQLFDETPESIAVAFPRFAEHFAKFRSLSV